MPYTPRIPGPVPPELLPRFPALVDQGAVFMDADLRVVGADAAYYSSFQVTPKETEGRLIQDLGDGQWNSPELRQLLEGVVTGDRSFTGHEVEHVFPGGVGMKRMSLHGARVAHTSKPTALVVMGFQDATERRAAEEALRHTEVRYRRLFQTAKDGILILDALSGKIIDANAFMEGLVGLEAGQLLGKQLFEIGMFKDIEENKAAFRELQRNRYIRYDHLPVQNQRGETVEVEFIANVYDEDDRLVAQCNVRDISERVRLEKKIAHQAVALADEARSKDEFLAMLSHELRNPLAPIRSAVYLLKMQGDADPVQRQAVDVIERQVGNLTKLVSDLLEVSRVINGRIRMNIQTVDIHQILRHAVQTITPLVDLHQHVLKMHLGPLSVWAHADAMRMEEVIVNLLNNAVKYTPDGGSIEIHCGVVDGNVQIQVSDNGVGLSEELLPRIFDLFSQADRSLARSQGGLGIGLALAHRLVTLQGGTITASSPGIGKGSSFFVRLPTMRSPEIPLELLVPPDAVAASTGSRVLVVDDNVDLVTVLASTLRYKGYSVQCAFTGPEGLRMAKAWVPDIVLLDIGLPGVDGYEVARRLRADPATSKARLIALTGYGQQSDIALTREAGFDAHLVKPYEFDELEKLILKP